MSVAIAVVASLSASAFVVVKTVTPVTVGVALSISIESLPVVPFTAPSFGVTVQVTVSPLAKAPLKVVLVPKDAPLPLVHSTVELSPSPSTSS